MSSHTCRLSGRQFVVTQDDLEFYRRISPLFGGKHFPLPPPTLHPELRAMRRLAWRNSHNLYRRTCDATGRNIISAYPAEAAYRVYATEVWWSDSWDQLASGRPYDSARTFFQQFSDLLRAAPRPSLMSRESENSEYCNYAGENKNCYMANNGSWYNDSCLLGEAYLHCRDCLDCSYLRKSELCYEAVCSEGLYGCSFIRNSYHSSNCHFSFNLRNCHDCFLSSNLRNKRNYILNRPASRAEVDQFKALLKTASGIEELRLTFTELLSSSFHPAVIHTATEDCTGEYLSNCKNVHQSYLVGTVRDGKYLLHCDEGSDLWDCSLSGYADSQLYYETVSSGAAGQRALFCSGSWSSNDVTYCDTVMSCSDCFGCVGLQRKQYCILNQQYSKDEYFETVRQIVSKMTVDGEWGEFFPPSLAPHAYDESHAPDFYPLAAEEAQQYGFRWRGDFGDSVTQVGISVPTSIGACEDSVCEQTYTCLDSGKPFRINTLELSLLRKFGIAPSPHAPEIRRKNRGRQRNQSRMWESRCFLGGEPILTSFAPELGRKVLCESCYRSELLS